MRRGCVSLLPAAAMILACVCPAGGAQDPAADRTVFDTPLPGGLTRALATLDDRGTPDRSQFLIEVIRRFYSIPIAGENDLRIGSLRSLVAQLDAAANATADAETLPLPLAPDAWTDAVFGGRAEPRPLVSRILASREASLLYCALLSLDEPTRAWLSGRRDLLASLARRHAAAFLVASPGLRVHAGRMELPGGEAARPVWAALAGADPGKPAEFIPALLAAREKRLAYFLGTLSSLSDAEITFALQLDRSAPDDRLTASRELFAVFEQLAKSWDIAAAPFWRPPLDPALLITGLSTNDHGTPVLPGTRSFWRLILDGRADERSPRAPVQLGWLCARVFSVPSRARSREYDMVLFASRHANWLDGGPEADTLDAVRAAGRFPALVATLERAGITDATTFAAAARRAAILDGIEDGGRASAGIAQFQGLLALVTRSAIRGGLSREGLPALIRSLAAVDHDRNGEYQGRLVDWVDGLAGEDDFDTIDARLVALLAGSPSGNRPVVDWEGTRYRVDLRSAEANRLAGLLGGQPRPLISSAKRLVRIARDLANPRIGRDELNGRAAELDTADEALRDVSSKAEEPQLAELARKIRKAAAKRRGDSGLEEALRRAADGLLARGAMELAYAVALGQPGAVPISVRDAASRHELGITSRPAGRAWELPDPGGPDGHWRVRGSLLGLDVRLAAFSLRRMTLRPPARPPSLDEFDRRVLTEAVTLVQPGAQADSEQDTIVNAIARGRARLASARGASEVAAIAREAHVGPARRTLLAWAVVRDPERVRAALAPSELFRLGSNSAVRMSSLDAWGAPAEPLSGCLCLRLSDRASWGMLAGRWKAGMIAAGFPDLNLRLAELLHQLRMPAMLLGPVLTAATLDLVENASIRDDDDRRGLVEYVQQMNRDRVEEYLALFTTDGPLVPLEATAGGASRPGASR